jgi:hypothetical protein
MFGAWTELCKRIIPCHGDRAVRFADTAPLALDGSPGYLGIEAVPKMKPKIDGSEFGSITIGGQRIDHDVVIRLSGEVAKRKKKLSKTVYGTSHILSLAEADFIYEKDAERLIIGTGQNGMVVLSPEAAKYFVEHRVEVDLSPTPEALARWNKASGKVIGLFHVTC